MDQAIEAAFDADQAFACRPCKAQHEGADHRVQPRAITTAGEDSYAHTCRPSWCIPCPNSRRDALRQGIPGPAQAAAEGYALATWTAISTPTCICTWKPSVPLSGATPTPACAQRRDRIQPPAQADRRAHGEAFMPPRSAPTSATAVAMRPSSPSLLSADRGRHQAHAAPLEPSGWPGQAHRPRPCISCPGSNRLLAAAAGCGRHHLALELPHACWRSPR